MTWTLAQTILYVNTHTGSADAGKMHHAMVSHAIGPFLCLRCPCERASFSPGSFSEIDTPAASDLHGFAAPCYDLRLGLGHAWLAVRSGAHRETWMFTFLLTRWRTASYFRLLPWCPKPRAFSTGPLWLIACLAWINIHVRLKKWDIKTQCKSVHFSGKGSWFDQSGQKVCSNF